MFLVPSVPLVDQQSTFIRGNNSNKLMKNILICYFMPRDYRNGLSLISLKETRHLKRKAFVAATESIFGHHLNGKMQLIQMMYW